LFAARKNGMRANIFNAYLEKSTNLGLILGQVLIIGAGAYLVTLGQLTAGDLAGFVGLLLNASGAFAALTAFAPDLVQMPASLRRIGELLNEPVDAPAEDDETHTFKFAREIRFTNVTFGYSDRPVLKNLSFTIQAGQSVAFVGGSGSGKSTIL